MLTQRGTIRVLIVDDHPLLCEGIAAVIANQGDMVLVAEAANGQEAIRSFQVHQPDVTLMDLRLPDMSGIDVIKVICRHNPDTKVIALTTYEGDVRVSRALRAGASAYLLKSMLRSELVQTIRMVHAGRRYLPAELASELADHALQEALTSREIQVLQEIAAGRANKAVATNLEITEGTVKRHLKKIFAKLSASDRTHAVMIAIRRGFLDV